MAVALTGLDEVVAEFRAEFRALHDKLDALSANGHSEVGWFDVEGAATYLSLSKAALERAVRRGTIGCVRTKNNRIRFSRSMLDSYAQGNGARS